MKKSLVAALLSYVRHLATKYLIKTTEHSGKDPTTNSGGNLRTKITSSPLCPQNTLQETPVHTNALRFILCLLVLWLTAILHVSSFLHTLCCLRPDKIPEYHTRLPRKSLWWNAKYCTCGTAENRLHILLSAQTQNSELIMPLQVGQHNMGTKLYCDYVDRYDCYDWLFYFHKQKKIWNQNDLTIYQALGWCIKYACLPKPKMMSSNFTYSLS